MAEETLTCEHGHTFTREATRGRKPRLCPEHRSAQVASAQQLSEPKSRVDDRALEILTGETDLDAEYRRKLEYTVTQLDSGRRDDDDCKLLVETQRWLINRFERSQSA